MANFTSVQQGTPEKDVLKNMGQMDDIMLIDLWLHYQAQAKEKIDIQGRIGMELTNRMREEGATARYHPQAECRLVSPKYDEKILYTLAELIPPEVFQTGYSPAHEETVTTQVDARFDMRTVTHWDKYGSAVAEIIERAEIPTSRRLSIKRGTDDA